MVYTYQDLSGSADSHKGGEAYRVFRDGVSVGWIRKLGGSSMSQDVWAIENDKKGTIPASGYFDADQAKEVFVGFNEQKPTTDFSAAAVSKAQRILKTLVRWEGAGGRNAERNHNIAKVMDMLESMEVKSTEPVYREIILRKRPIRRRGNVAL